MIEKIETQWLLSFKSVYEQLSFKLAAEQLQIPSSNVSRHVSLLEKSLNSRLLERTTRKMQATAAGTKLYHSLIPLMQAMDDALEEVSLHGESVSGHLKMITPDLPFMGEVIADFCLQHPQIQLSCDTQLNPNEGLMDGFDLILSFGRGPLDDSGWVAKEILRWPSCVVAAPEQFEKHSSPTTLDELSKVPCITSLSVLQGTPWRFKNQEKLQVQSSYKVNSGNLAKAAALKGLGFAILPLHACQAEIASGDLIELKLDQEPEDLVLHAFYSGRKYPLQKVKAFLTHLTSSLGNL
ncbi:putative transcriptional regulator, LysR family protein [Marinomonas sp. MED121]|uniref:LysR family transcriptional regulator n=1 Tax=Marinomonas sp. MED121 TaxID=314277 RepID=UPI000069019B|nr:LysR family transcriptional regulator [Marinomonas sp. MED121]EAQ64350.1 putative transcriptional regulator, LysR family protein [Marinomonas sp. MED121]